MIIAPKLVWTKDENVYKFETIRTGQDRDQKAGLWYSFYI